MSFLWKNFKILFNKTDFCFDAPIATTFHPQLTIVLAINGIFFNNKTSKLRFIIPTICTLLAIYGTLTEAITCVVALSRMDISTFIEAFAYGVIVGVVPFIFYCLFKNSEKVYTIVNYMNEDFTILCSLGDDYKKKFIDGQLTIWKCSMVWMVFVIFVACMYILLSVGAVMYYCLTTLQDIDSHRPTIFPSEYPKSFKSQHVTPFYEITMFLQYLNIIDFVLTFTCYVYLTFHMLLHAYFLIDMVLISIEKLFIGLDPDVGFLENSHERYVETKQILDSRIKFIVISHNKILSFVSTVLDLFGICTAYQITFSSIAICLMVFYISMLKEEGKVDICISLLTVGAFLQLWIPCYIGSLLQVKGLKIADACIYSGWHIKGLARMVGTDLQIIMIQAQKPISIQVAPLPELQLETFSSIMSTSYSYFNMLQQRQQ